MDADKIQALHAIIAETAPIDGISVGRWNDRATWRIDFRDEATRDQRYAAQQALASFDPDSANVEPGARTKLARFLEANPDVVALIK